MAEVLEVVVNRPQWHRGQGGSGYGEGDNSPSALLIPGTGKMCCLGFACIAAGLTPDQIRGKGYPYNIEQMTTRARPSEDPKILPPSLQPLVAYEPDGYVMNSDTGSRLAKTNDDESITDVQREERIIALGAGVGLKFTFVN